MWLLVWCLVILIVGGDNDLSLPEEPATVDAKVPESDGGGAKIHLMKNCHRLRLPAQRST